MKKRSLFIPVIFAACVLPISHLRAQANDNPTGPSGMFNGNVTSGCSYDPYTGNAVRSVTDIVVSGAVGQYPLAFTRIFDSRRTNGMSTAFGYSGWSHSYGWSIGDSAQRTTPVFSAPPAYSVGFPDGRAVAFQSAAGDTLFRGPKGVSERFIPLNSATMLAYLLLADGGKIEFKATLVDDGVDHETGTEYWHYSYAFQAIIDQYGLRTTVTHPADGSTTITEPAGRWLKIFYGTVFGSTVISSVSASDGRVVQYTYQSAYFPPGTVNWTVLSQVSYYADATIGTAAYTYKGPNVGDPNGAPLLSTAYDPMFAGPMTRIAYDYATAAGSVIGQILSEKFGAYIYVSTAGVPNATTRTETRGDGPWRSFTYAGNLLTSWTDFNHVPMSQTYDTNNYVNSFTDTRGNTSDMIREAITGRITKITHPMDANGVRYFVTYAYTDPANPYYLDHATDELSHTTTYTRDALHRVTRIDYADGGYETFTYNSFNEILTHRMTSGGTETFTYDTRGMKTTYRDPYHATGNPTAWYLYDAYDRLWKVTDSRGTAAGTVAYTTISTYNKRGEVTRVTHPDATFIQYGYDSDGNRTSVTDELNHTTTYDYDYYRRVIKATDPLTNYSTTGYIPWGQTSSYLTTSNFAYTAVAPSGKRVYNYPDNNLRLASSTQAPGTSDAATTSYTYDAVGNTLTVTAPNGQPGQIFAGAHSTFTYDKRNRRLIATDALNHSTSWDYDAAGNLKKETRPDNQFRTCDIYDAMNRVKKTTGFSGETTNYVYDLDGTVTQLTDAKGAIYSFGYDLMNRKTSETYPADYYGATRSETWSYDIAGNLSTHSSPVGFIKTFTYDARNRERTASWNTTYGQSVGSTTTYDAANRVISIVSGSTTVAFGYDNANHKIWEDQTLTGLPARRVNSLVDIDGNVSQLYVTGAFGVIYDYNNRQQLAHINNGAIPWFTYTYDSSGNLTKRQDVGQGSDSTNFTYDKLNRVTLCEQTGASDASFAHSHYDYDVLNNLQDTWRDEQANKGERFTYDPDNQLQNVVYNADNVTGTPTNADRTVSYSFTNRLNRTNMTDSDNGGTTTSYTPNALNQYTAVGAQAPVYDGNFNLYQINGWTYIHDADGRLTSATATGHSAQFVYDGLGRCVKRTIDGVATLFTYDGWKPILEWDAAGNRTAFNVYGPGADEILVRWQATGWLHYHLDRMGNVQFLLDGTNNGLEKYTYDVFGQPKITSWVGTPQSESAFGNRFMFAGREYLTTLGIYDYRHRFYHPGLGRFLETDPIGFGGGDGNLFRYAAHNPVNEGDPMGTTAGPWPQHVFGTGHDCEPGVPNASMMGAGGVSDGMMGYDGNSGAGLYVFNQGDMGVDLGNGMVYGGPANRNGLSLDGKPVLPAQPVTGSGPNAPAASNVFGAIGDVIGKIWALPNTLIGLAIGIASLPFGGEIHFDNNAIQFTNVPFGPGGALTLGNVQLFTNGMDPSSSDSQRYDGGPGAVPVGLHEQAHTYQNQLLGPFFLPAYFFRGGITSHNPFENAADNFAQKIGSWWPGGG